MPHLSRRVLLTGTGLLALGAAGAFGATWFNVGASNSGQSLLDPAMAHRAALAGTILLVDIRRPDEWTRTGVGEGAHPLDMRRADFTAALATLAGGEVDRPIALICARGVRSRRLSQRLAAAGFTRILDVPEGMLGSGAGPGWLGRALPVVPWEA
ncbi:MAG: rhodanese-like domain-containing protein [Pseudomonadota bacterium]